MLGRWAAEAEANGQPSGGGPSFWALAICLADRAVVVRERLTLARYGPASPIVAGVQGDGRPNLRASAHRDQPDRSIEGVHPQVVRLLLLLAVGFASRAIPALLCGAVDRVTPGFLTFATELLYQCGQHPEASFGSLPTRSRSRVAARMVGRCGPERARAARGPRQRAVRVFALLQGQWRT